MTRTCPNCKERLPYIGKDIPSPGEKVRCGICYHVWRFDQPATIVVEWRIRPELRERCACKSQDDQFAWTRYKTVPTPDAPALVKQWNAVTTREGAAHIFEYRVKPARHGT